MSEQSREASPPQSWSDHRGVQVLSSRLEVLSHWTDVHPFFKVHQNVSRDTALIDGRELLNFSTYNYLGLSGDPRVSEAAKRAIDRYGTSVSASRITSGEKDLHGELERELAAWLGTEAAIVFVSGHATNVNAIGHLFNRRDLVLYDALAHNSVMQGGLLAGARLRAFRHNDVAHLDALLREHRGDTERALIVTEGVFSMDGDTPDLPALVELKRRHRAYLMVDEAHSLGVLGKTGRGLGEHFGVPASDVDLWMGTLSKSLASCGGYIAGSAELVRYLKYTAPGFVYSVGLTPPDTAAALEALRILKAEPERVERLRQNARLFLSCAREAGLDTHHAREGAVAPVLTGSSFRAVKLSDALYRRGINVDPVISPAVEQDKARLRFFASASHSEEQIRWAVRCIAEEIALLPERMTIGGEILATLPSRDRAHLPVGNITDPGRVYRKRARLWDPISGQPERLFDPTREDQRGGLLRSFFEAWIGNDSATPPELPLHPEAVVSVPAVAGAAMAGRWFGSTAFARYWAHQSRVRPSRLEVADYVMPHGDEVVVAGRRLVRGAQERFLYLFTFVEQWIVRVEEIVASDAWPGEGPEGPEAQTVAVSHDPRQAADNLRATAEMYEIFVRNADIARFVERCAPDLHWEVPGPAQLPFTGVWRGPDGMLEFWRSLAVIMDFHEYWLDSLMARGDRVFVIGGFRSTAIPTALAYSDPFLHVATYGQGVLKAFRETFDPCITLAAYRPDLLVG